MCVCVRVFPTEIKFMKHAIRIAVVLRNSSACCSSMPPLSSTTRLYRGADGQQKTKTAKEHVNIKFKIEIQTEKHASNPART